MEFEKCKKLFIHDGTFSFNLEADEKRKKRKEDCEKQNFIQFVSSNIIVLQINEMNLSKSLTLFLYGK